MYELLPDPIGEGGGKTLADIFAYHYGMKKEGNVNEEQVKVHLCIYFC